MNLNRIVTLGLAIILLTSFSISFSSKNASAIPVILPSLKVISNFDGGIGIEWYNVNGVSTDDTVNFKNGTKSIKMNANNPYTDRIRFNFSTSPDLRQVQYFYFRTHTPDIANLTTHLIYFVKDPSNYFSAWGGPKMTMWPSTEEWFEWGISRNSFSMTGNMLWNETNYIQITAYCLAGKGPIDVTFDQMTYRENIRDKGVISIWMDDSDNGLYDYGAPALDRYNYKASVAWTGENIESITKLQALKGNGYEISFHGYTHLDMTTMNQAELTWQVASWFNNAANYSLLKQPYIGTTTYGSMTYDLGHYLMENFTLIRSAASFGYQTWPFCVGYNQYGTQIDSKSISDMETILNFVTEHKFQYNMIIHKIGPEASYWNQSNWEELINYIAFKNLDVRTYSQLLNEQYYPAPIKYPTPDIMYYLIPIGMIMMVSLASSLLKERGTFSMNVFMASFSIGIGVVVWTGIFPAWTIIISILLIVGMLFMGRE